MSQWRLSLERLGIMVLLKEVLKQSFIQILIKRRFCERNRNRYTCCSNWNSAWLVSENRTPKLNIDLLKELNQQIDLPFVLHGGSGNPDAEVSEAVKYGVAKVNLSSDLKSVFFNALREILSENPSMYEPNAIYPAANKRYKKWSNIKWKF